jgi:ProP effector
VHCVKKGVQRVDLDGKDVAVIEDEHVEHAKKQLDESKEKVAQKRKAQQALAAEAKKPLKTKDVPKFKPSSKKTSKDVVKESTKPKPQPAQRLNEEQITVGTAVTVKIGKSPMPATISAVNKDGIQVQLDTGMVVKVQLENLRLARLKR